MLADPGLSQAIERRLLQAQQADQGDGRIFDGAAFDDYVLQAFSGLMDDRIRAARRDRRRVDSASPQSRRTFSPRVIPSPITTTTPLASEGNAPRVRPARSPTPTTPPQNSTGRLAPVSLCQVSPTPVLPALSPSFAPAPYCLPRLPSGSSPIATPCPPSRNSSAPGMLTNRGQSSLGSSPPDSDSMTLASKINPCKRRKISGYEASFLQSIAEAIQHGITDCDTVVGFLNERFNLLQPAFAEASPPPVSAGSVDVHQGPAGDIPLENAGEDVSDVPLDNSGENVTNAPLESSTDDFDPSVMLTASPPTCNLDGGPMEIDQQPSALFGGEMDDISQPGLEDSEMMRDIVEDVDPQAVVAGEIRVMGTGQDTRGSAAADGEHASSGVASNDPAAHSGGSTGDVATARGRETGAEVPHCDMDSVSEEEDNIGRRPDTKRKLHVVISDDEDDEGSDSEHSQNGHLFEESEDSGEDDVSDIDVDALDPWEEEEDVQYVGTRQAFQPPISSFPLIPPDVETLSEDLLSQLHETM